MSEWDDWVERVTRASHRARIAKLVLWLVVGVLIALVLESDDPDKYGWWLVGGVVAFGAVVAFLAFRQRVR